MAAASQPLYSLDREDFDAAVCSIASRALPGFTVGFRDDSATSDTSTLVPLKRLPDALANPGPAGSCSQCQLNVLEGCMVDICLACGAKSYAAGLVSQLPWSGSIAEQKFLRSIPYKTPKNRRKSGNKVPAFASPTDGFSDPRQSPDIMSPSGSPAVPAGAIAGSTAAADSPWSSTLDTSAADPMNVFSLADAALELERSGAPAAPSRDASALDDFFAQLGDIPASAQSRSQGPQQGQQQGQQQGAKASSTADPAVQAVLNGFPDLSFLLAESLVLPEKDPGNFPPKVPENLPVPTAGASVAGALSGTVSSSATAPLAPPAVPPLSAMAQMPAPSLEEDEGQDEWGDFES